MLNLVCSSGTGVQPKFGPILPEVEEEKLDRAQGQGRKELLHLIELTSVPASHPVPSDQEELGLPNVDLGWQVNIWVTIAVSLCLCVMTAVSYKSRALVFNNTRMDTLIDR